MEINNNKTHDRKTNPIHFPCQIQYPKSYILSPEKWSALRLNKRAWKSIKLYRINYFSHFAKCGFCTNICFMHSVQYVYRLNVSIFRGYTFFTLVWNLIYRSAIHLTLLIKCMLVYVWRYSLCFFPYRHFLMMKILCINFSIIPFLLSHGIWFPSHYMHTYKQNCVLAILTCLHYVLGSRSECK